MWYKVFLENGLIPDFLIRWKIRKLLQERLEESMHFNLESFVSNLKSSPIAIETKAANEQHYEVPTEFYKLCLGKNLKYSGCLFEGTEDLDAAEEKMLELYCERGEFKDGMDVLELGCGWGSLSLFLAKKYPNSKITGLSNSSTQKIFIDAMAAERGIRNLEIITADINVFSIAKQFDRVVSIEMFEHLRNYQELFKRISSWMKPDARMFVHIFSHKDFAYKFEVKDESDWMSKYFFTGGIMPSHRLFFEFSEHLKIEKDWKVNGTHYGKTAECWLRKMDENKIEIIDIFERCYGPDQAKKWFEYWRIFFMSCAELWNFRNGEEWGVSHYLFRKA